MGSCLYIAQDMLAGDSLPQEVVENIKNVSEEDIEDVCSAAENILAVGTDTAGNIIKEETKAVLFALTFLVKGRFREAEARNILENLVISEKVLHAVVESYIRLAAKYAIVLKKNLTLSKIHFKKMDWRFQVTLASRSFLNKTEPRVLTKLLFGKKNTKKEDKELLIEMTVRMLQKMVNTMEEALAESNSPLAKKLART